MLHGPAIAVSRTELASTSASQGSSLVGVQDSASYYTATTVEGVLAEIGATMQGAFDIERKRASLAAGINLTTNFNEERWVPSRNNIDLAITLSTGITDFSYPDENVMRIDSGTTAGQAFILKWRSIGAGVPACFAGGGASDKWYLSARMRVPTAVGTDAECQVGLNSASTIVKMGMAGGVSTTKFSVQKTASSFAGATNIDTAMHIHRLWYDGTNTNYQVDEGTVTQQAGNALAGDDGALYVIAYNVSAASSRKLDVNWIYLMAARGGA